MAAKTATELMDELDGPEPQAETGHDAQVPAVIETHPVQTQDPARYMSLREMRELANIAMTSRLVKIANPEEAVIKMLFGREMGLGPMFSLKHLYVVNNTPALSAGVIGALIKKHPKYDYRVLEHDDSHCVLEFYQDDEVAGRSSFTISDAQDAGLLGKEVWQKYPRNMLFSRALTNGARWYCPDVFNGPIYTPEELSVTVEGQDDEDGPVSYQALPQATPKPGPVSPDEYVKARTDYPAGLELDDVRSGEVCPLHGEPFFKKGRMRDHAHKVSENEWCNYANVKARYTGRASQALEDFGHTTPDDKEQACIELMPDLVGVPVQNWRIVDWMTVLDTFSTGESDDDPQTGEDEEFAAD